MLFVARVFVAVTTIARLRLPPSTEEVATIARELEDVWGMRELAIKGTPGTSLALLERKRAKDPTSAVRQVVQRLFCS